MSLKRINEILNTLLEDYLSLDDKIVEIGVLTYLFQTGKLNKGRENKLREYIKEATEDIKGIVINWLVQHGLSNLAIELGEDRHSITQYWEDLHDFGSILDRINSLELEDGYVGGTDLSDLASELSRALGGSQYFGSDVVEYSDLKTFIEDHLESEVVEEGTEDEYTSYYVDMSEDDIAEFLIDCKASQVESNSEFMNLADEMTETVKELEDNIDIYDTKELVLKFDRLKDLNHANGNLLSDYGGLDWGSINSNIEDRVTELRNKKGH